MNSDNLITEYIVLCHDGEGARLEVKPSEIIGGGVNINEGDYPIHLWPLEAEALRDALTKVLADIKEGGA